MGGREKGGRVSSLKDPMCTDLVTTRSLPFGFRSVNRKLQPRLVCNEHNGDGSRVKVGQLGRGKRATARQAARALSLALLSHDPLPMENIKGRNEPFGRDRSCGLQEKKNEPSELHRSIMRERESSRPVVAYRARNAPCIIRVWTNTSELRVRTQRLRTPFAINAPL